MAAITAHRRLPLLAGQILLAHCIASYAMYAVEFARQLTSNERVLALRWQSIGYFAFAPLEALGILVLMAAAIWPVLTAHFFQLALTYLVSFFGSLYALKHDRRTVPAAVTLVALAAAHYASGLLGAPERPRLVQTPNLVAPDVALLGLDGLPHRLSDERGRVVLIDCWSTSCPPCVFELKDFTSAAAADKSLSDRGLTVWAINEGEDEATIRRFMAANNFTFTVLLDPKATFAGMIGDERAPTSAVVGRDGVIKGVFAGYYSGDRNAIRRVIEHALN
jgi:peroxiredoxin